MRVRAGGNTTQWSITSGLTNGAWSSHDTGIITADGTALEIGSLAGTINSFDIDNIVVTLMSDTDKTVNNRELYMMQSRLQKAKTNQAKAVYDNIDRPRLLKKQDSDYDFLFVRALKSGAEIREGESPYLALLEAGVNQATDLAIADFNSRQAFYDGMNQSLLTAFKGEGEMFKGRVLAQAEMIKGIATAGGNYASTGSLLG